MRWSETSVFMAATAEADGSVPSSIGRVNESGARLRRPGRSDEVARHRLGVRDRRAAEAARECVATSCLSGASERSKRWRPRRYATAWDGSARAKAAAIAVATRSSRGTSYQRCGFASLPWTPRTSAIVTTTRFLLGAAFSSLVMKAS